MKYSLSLIVLSIFLAMSGCCKGDFDHQIAIDDFIEDHPNVEVDSLIGSYRCSGPDCICWYVEIRYRMPEWENSKDTTLQYWTSDKGETWINRTEYLEKNF